MDRPGRGLARSVPIHYLVARDSLLTADALAEHYEAVEQRFHQAVSSDPELDYLGTRPQHLARRLDQVEIDAHFDASRFSAGFATAELAVNTDVLAAALRHAVARTRAITFLLSHEAHSISEQPGGFRVEGGCQTGRWEIDARQVVNATWENRLVFDAQLGLPPPEQRTG